jgi:hypothetical protein
MSNIAILYVGNDSVLEVAALKNELTGADLNAAAVTVQLKDSTGVDVAGETWPKNMAYVAGSKGIYRATLPYTLALAAGGRYVATIVADAGAGLRAEWFVECQARMRN